MKSLLDTPEINSLESRLVSLFDRTFQKGISSGPQLKNSIKKQFVSKTFEKQIDKIIDDLYLFTIEHTDKLIKKSLSASLQRSQILNVLYAAKGNTSDEPLILTEEAIKECTTLSSEITESIIRTLKDEGIYQENPRILAKRILDLWGGEKYRAERWARTFSADVATNTTLYRYKQQGIEYCQFYARIDGRTSPQCRSLHGTIFHTDSHEAARYSCPLHFSCRSSLIPYPASMELDQNLLYENRDFTQALNQDLKPLAEGLDKDFVKKTFKEIDKFKKDWAIPQFILDEDIEKRLIKLGLGISI